MKSYYFTFHNVDKNNFFKRNCLKEKGQTFYKEYACVVMSFYRRPNLKKCTIFWNTTLKEKVLVANKD